MKSITIHGIDDDLDKKIHEKSREFGLSQNKTVKELLKKSVGSTADSEKKASFSDLFGKWTGQEQKEFEGRLSDLEKVDPSDWTR